MCGRALWNSAWLWIIWVDRQCYDGEFKIETKRTKSRWRLEQKSDIGEKYGKGYIGQK